MKDSQASQSLVQIHLVRRTKKSLRFKGILKLRRGIFKKTEFQKENAIKFIKYLSKSLESFRFSLGDIGLVM